jgi:hypothetical protein
VGTLTLTAGVGSYKSDSLGPDRITSWGGQADLRVIGGSLLPVAVNVQAGAVRTSAVEGLRQTYVMGAVGLAVPLPAPGISIEPYLSPGLRYRNFGPGNGSSTQFGYAAGANLGFGVFGVHVAYDYEHREGGGGVGVFGLGAHVTLRLLPMGM